MLKYLFAVEQASLWRWMGKVCPFARFYAFVKRPWDVFIVTVVIV